MIHDGTSMFLCRVTNDGYQWIRSRYFPSRKPSMDEVRGPEWFLVEGKKRGEQFLATEFDPLKRYPALFRTFGELVCDDRDQILQFANQYGLLGEQKLLYQETKKDPSQLELVWGELIYDWTSAIRLMRWAIQIWDWIQERNTQMLSKHIFWQPEKIDEKGSKVHVQGWVFSSHPGEPFQGKIPGQMSKLVRPNSEDENTQDVMLMATFLLQDWINDAMKGKVSARLLYHHDHSKEMLFFVPSNLHSAMWLQLAQTVSGNKKHRQCKECGSWFEISKNKDARTERRLFCSNSCKVRDYRRRLTMAEASRGKASTKKTTKRNTKQR